MALANDHGAVRRVIALTNGRIVAPVMPDRSLLSSGDLEARIRRAEESVGRSLLENGPEKVEITRKRYTTSDADEDVIAFGRSTRRRRD